MNRMMITLVSLALFAVACGSDGTIEVSAQEPEEPTTEPTAEPVEPDEPAESATEPDDELILGGGPYPIGTINFVVTNSDSGAQTATYTLSCLGDTATLTGDWEPESDPGLLGGPADGMCLSLGEAAVQSRLIDGVPTDLACTQVYGSADRADVTGELSGQPVATTFSRTDGCGIADWDDLMAGLLPPATT